MLTVREKNIWNLFKNDKTAARAHQIRGKVHFVAPTTAYVSGYTVASAQSWARENHALVYDTANLAYAACVDGRGDAVVYLPGTHTPTASIAHAKAGISYWGPEAWAGRYVRKPSAIIVAPAGDEAFNITGPDAAFIGLACVPVTTKAFADFTGGADGLTIKNCYIDLHTPAVNIATAGFSGSAGVDNFLFEENAIWSDGAQGPGLTLTGNHINGVCRRNLWHNDAGSWAVAASLIDIDGLLVEFDMATCGGTAMTACYNGSGTTVIAGVIFRRCETGVLVTKFVDGFATTTHAQLVQNYIAEIGGGTGGVVLVTAIT